MERLTRRDWDSLAICAAVFAISLGVTLQYFSSAFPEASIEFRLDRKTSVPVAERLLTAQHIDTTGMKHTAVFDSDDNAKIFLERTLGPHEGKRRLQARRAFMVLAPPLVPSAAGGGSTTSTSRRRARSSPTTGASPKIARCHPSTRRPGIFAAEAFLARAGARATDLQLVSAERATPAPSVAAHLHVGVEVDSSRRGAVSLYGNGRRQRHRRLRPTRAGARAVAAFVRSAAIEKQSGGEHRSLVFLVVATMLAALAVFFASPAFAAATWPSAFSSASARLRSSS